MEIRTEQIAARKRKQKEYREKNREILKQRRAKYYKEHSDLWDKYNKDGVSKRINRLEILEKTSPEEFRIIRATRACCSHNAHAIRRTNKNTKPVNIELLLSLYLNHNRCALCGTGLIEDGNKENGKQFDHIIPLRHGGLHSIENIRIVCKKCNQKTNCKILKVG